ncbi:MAG: PKD domain-containing protein [Thermoplasmata archaeon]|nr:PKD domain-containing protein [Thermoplasmata archaeon]
MTYDVSDGYVVLFGGGNVSTFYNDTWKFQSGTWTNITPVSSPPAVADISLAYDAADGYVVLTNGLPCAGPAPGCRIGYLNETWKFSAGVWSQIVTTAHPPGYAWAAMTYDYADHYLLFYGGVDPLSGSAGMPYTWKYIGGAWTNITSGPQPNQAFRSAMTYDVSDGYVLLFGGGPRFGLEWNYTWKFVGGSWTNISTAVAPPGVELAGLVYDETLSEVVVFGGYNASSRSDLAETWVFHAGTWTAAAPTGTPPGREEAGLANDSHDGYLVLFGGNEDGVAGYDTWTLMANSSVPLAASAGENRTRAPVGQLVSFTGLASGGTPPYTYGWSFGDGSANSSLQNPSHAYTTAGTFDPQLAVKESLGATNASSLILVVTAEVTSTYTVSFQETGLAPETPWSVTLASTPSGSSTNSIVFSGLVNGTYAYSVAAVTGFASSPSAGSVLLAGASKMFDINFTAISAVFTASLSASPANFTLGASTTLLTSVAGGAGPFSYVYSVLPSGCSTANTTSINCTPTATGIFDVRVTVTGDFGAEANGSARVTVQSSPANPGTPPSPATGGSALLYYGLGAAVIVALVIALLLLRGRRRRTVPLNQTQPAPPRGVGPPP